MSRSLVFALLVACAAQPRPRPEDMSATAHRAEAARERAEAREHRESHGRGVDALDDGLPGGLEGARAAGMSLRGRVLHPDGAQTELFAAEVHREHAKQHEEAAAELERFEAAECRDVAVEERAPCPLLIGAGALVDVKDGVEVRFRLGSPVDDVERRMRCHLAFAQTRGFGEAAACPLYMKGVKIARAGVQIIRITASDATTVRELRRAAAEQVSPGHNVGSR